MRVNLIGFAGRAGAGKSTAADHVVAKYGYNRDAYARVMKEAVALLFGIDLEILKGDITVKSQVDPYWGVTYRQILQCFGTEAMRGAFGGLFWIKVLWRRYADGLPGTGLVIDDVRFIEEAIAIRGRGGIIIQIVKPELEPVELNWWAKLMDEFWPWGAKTHASEVQLPPELVDYVIINDGTKEQLGLVIDRVLGERW